MSNCKFCNTPLHRIKFGQNYIYYVNEDHTVSHFRTNHQCYIRYQKSKNIKKIKNVSDFINKYEIKIYHPNYELKVKFYFYTFYTTELYSKLDELYQLYHKKYVLYKKINFINMEDNLI